MKPEKMPVAANQDNTKAVNNDGAAPSSSSAVKTIASMISQVSETTGLTFVFYNVNGQLDAGNQNDDNAIVIVENDKGDGKSKWDFLTSIAETNRSGSSSSRVSAYIQFMTQGELLDRANLIMGEGGGQFMDEYAWAICNAKSFGENGKGPSFSEERMKIRKWQANETKYNYPAIKNNPQYAIGQTNAENMTFQQARARGLVGKFRTKYGTADHAMAANIQAILKLSKNPIGMANSWAGGETSYNSVMNNPDYPTKVGLINIPFYHVFYEQSLSKK